jgi:hypothetical protein
MAIGTKSQRHFCHKKFEKESINCLQYTYIGYNKRGRIMQGQEELGKRRTVQKRSTYYF